MYTRLLITVSLSLTSCAWATDKLPEADADANPAVTAQPALPPISPAEAPAETKAAVIDPPQQPEPQPQTEPKPQPVSEENKQATITVTPPPAKAEVSLSSATAVVTAHKENKQTAKPITTGFFDQILRESSMDNYTKGKAVESKVEERRNYYRLLSEQISISYLTNENLRTEELTPQINYLCEFINNKRRRLEDKWMLFLKTIKKPASTLKDGEVCEAIGTYSGKLNGNEEAQARYAFKKHQEYLFIHTFVKNFPLPKFSTNPIILEALKKERENLVEKLSKAITHVFNEEKYRDLLKSNNSKKFDKEDVNSLFVPASDIIDEVLEAVPIHTIDEMLDDQYSLKSFSKVRVNKWSNRMGLSQKQRVSRLFFDKMLTIEQGWQ